MSLGLKMAGWSEPESEAEFERLVEETERLARDGVAPDPEEVEFMALDPYDDEDFAELVRDAMDELPDLLQRALERNVAVVISDGGRRAGAYGLYHGDGVARDDVPDRIVIFRDTLRRDFGHDPDRLREEVTRTVRHELAHHLGADELGVRDLGL
jgi:predicted Zn-dependent protease with MMP-like domain